MKNELHLCKNLRIHKTHKDDSVTVLFEYKDRTIPMHIKASDTSLFIKTPNTFAKLYSRFVKLTGHRDTVTLDNYPIDLYADLSEGLLELHVDTDKYFNDENNIIVIGDRALHIGHKGSKITYSVNMAEHTQASLPTVLNERTELDFCTNVTIDALEDNNRNIFLSFDYKNRRFNLKIRYWNDNTVITPINLGIIANSLKDRVKLDQGRGIWDLPDFPITVYYEDSTETWAIPSDVVKEKFETEIKNGVKQFTGYVTMINFGESTLFRRLDAYTDEITVYLSSNSEHTCFFAD